MFLTDKIARKAFCVGGLFYPINSIEIMIKITFEKALKLTSVEF